MMPCRSTCPNPTGGVPAHDERDLEFAKKFDLPIAVVVQPTGDEPAMGFTGEGIAINSPVINGLTSAEAKKKITAWLEEQGHGKRAINYKLRDWLIRNCSAVVDRTRSA